MIFSFTGTVKSIALGEKWIADTLWYSPLAGLDAQPHSVPAVVNSIPWHVVILYIAQAL